MYVIMGATGQTGGAALRALQARDLPVRAVTRDPAAARAALGPSVEIAQAAAEDADALARAFHGATGVYVLNAPAVRAPDPFAAAAAASAGIAAALAAAKPPRVVALSSEGAHRAEGTGIVVTLHDFEAALAGAGVPLARLRATYFMENWAAVFAPAREHGVLPSFLQPLDRPVRMVSVADIGETVANLLLDPTAPEITDLVGPADYTPAEAAAVLTSALGRPVEAVAPPREAWEPALVAAGLGAGYAAALASLYDAINADAMGFGSNAPEPRRGRVTLQDALTAALG